MQFSAEQLGIWILIALFLLDAAWKWAAHKRAEKGELEPRHTPGIDAKINERARAAKRPVAKAEPLANFVLAVAELRKNLAERQAGSVRLSRQELEHHLQNGGLTFMTAENPNAQQLHPRDNATRNRMLERDLSRMGARFHRVKGRYGGNEENSYMIFHDGQVTPEAIEKLGAKYGQESVLHSIRGEHRLKYVSGPNAGNYHPGMGYTMDQDAPDFYSKARGVPLKFTANLDFGTTMKSEHAKHDRSFEVETSDGVVRLSFAHHPEPKRDGLVKSDQGRPRPWTWKPTSGSPVEVELEPHPELGQKHLTVRAAGRTLGAVYKDQNPERGWRYSPSIELFPGADPALFKKVRGDGIARPEQAVHLLMSDLRSHAKI